MKQKRIIVIILLIVLFFAPASLVFAQNEHQGDAAGQSENGAHPNEMMMGRGMMMDDGMMDMMNMMNVIRCDLTEAPTSPLEERAKSLYSRQPCTAGVELNRAD